MPTEPASKEHRISMDVKAPEERMRTICWKLPFRGLYGETLLHILIVNNTSVHTRIAKILVKKYPALVHDVFESDEYYGRPTNV